jgi:hypothetical protein
MQVVEDKEHHRLIYFLVKDEATSEIKLWCYTQEKLYNLSKSISTIISDKAMLVATFSPNDHTEVILID